MPPIDDDPPIDADVLKLHVRRIGDPPKAEPDTDAIFHDLLTQAPKMLQQALNKSSALPGSRVPLSRGAPRMTPNAARGSALGARASVATPLEAGYGPGFRRWSGGQRSFAVRGVCAAALFARSDRATRRSAGIRAERAHAAG